MFPIYKPDHTISSHHSCCRPICVREERQLATCRSRHDALTQLSLGKVVLGADDALFYKIKPISWLSAPEDDSTGRVLPAGKVYSRRQLKVLILVAQALEDLQYKPERLIKALLLGWVLDIDTTESAVSRLDEMAPTRRVEQRVTRIPSLTADTLSHTHIRYKEGLALPCLGILEC